MRSLRFVGIILFLGILACSLPGQQNTPTPTLAPLLPATPEPPAQLPATPELRPPFSVPEEVISVRVPGPQSSVTSPITISGIADPTFEQNLVIRITDENGDTLAVQPTTIQSDIGLRGPYEAQVEFSVATDQPGRISVFDVDARDGSLVHLSSVNVILLAAGAASIEAPGSGNEVIAITAPEFRMDISGGTLVVEGFSEYFFEANLGVVICAGGSEADVPDPLCGTANNVLARGFATIAAPDIGMPGPFQGEIAYSVTEATLARVIVYADSPRDGGLLHASSTLVTLLP